MKRPIGTTLLALTVACVAEGLVFQPAAPASADVGGETDALAEPVEAGHLRIGLRSMRSARQQP